MTKIIAIPPFVESPDDIRCGQTVTLMILKHFLPDREWTFEDADKICGYVEGKWTWNVTAAVSLIEYGFEVVTLSSFNRKKFVEQPIEYMYELYGEEKAKVNIENSDIDMAVGSVRKLLESPHDQNFQRDWEWSDAERLLNEGYLLHTWVNPHALYSRQDKKFAGHFVLMYDYDPQKQRVFIHDGGSLYEGENGEFRPMNRNHSICFGTDHFMNAAKSAKGTGGTSLYAFRLRKEK